MTPTRFSAIVHGPAVFVAHSTNSNKTYQIGALFYPFLFLKRENVSDVALLRSLTDCLLIQALMKCRLFATFYLGLHCLPKNAFKRHQYIKG